MTIHQVKHSTIPVAAFKPDQAKHLPKVLRWYRHENFNDYPLQVEREQDGTFVLWVEFVSVSLSAREGEVGAIKREVESLAQTTVDKIEVAPASVLKQGCDFVIFEESPKTQERFQHKGQ